MNDSAMITKRPLGPISQWGLMFKIEVGLAILLLLSAIVALCSGCQTRLAPEGVYKGDSVLYTAENTVVTSHEFLQDFVTWEANYRQVLAQWPEIRKAADKVVTEGPSWFLKANSAIQIYKANPIDANKTTLLNALDILRAVIHEASGYMTSHQPLAPPPASLAKAQKI